MSEGIVWRCNVYMGPLIIHILICPFFSEHFACNLELLLLYTQPFCLFTCTISTNTFQLTFMNRASCIQDGRTATLQMLHFIYFLKQI